MEDKAKVNLKEELARFFSELNFRLELFESVKHKLDVYLASEFNVFSYISPDENRLSDIIAELLNPRGRHGQGEVFLREFLRILGKSMKCGSRCKVVREQVTDAIPQSQRRIDILLEIDGFGVGIENKPWAGEQAEQLSDYHKYLKSKYKDNYLLVYLSGSGGKPQSISPDERQRLEDEGKLKILSYAVGFKAWLIACYKECRAEKIRWFLNDFIDFVERNFAIDINEEEEA
jgi:hypothetical protein